MMTVHQSHSLCRWQSLRGGSHTALGCQHLLTGAVHSVWPWPPHCSGLLACVPCRLCSGALDCAPSETAASITPCRHNSPL